MMTRVFAWTILLFTLVSCNPNQVFRQLDTDFEDNRWPRAQIRSYRFTIAETGLYDLKLLFGYAAAVQFARIPIEMELTDASGRVSYQNIILRTKDANGKERGDCLGDYCDLEQTVFVHRKLNAGSYTIRLSNGFNHDYLPNVTALGIALKKTAL